MKTPSLRWRLTVLVALVLIGGFAVIALVAYWEMEESLQRDAGHTLAALTAAALASPDESDDDIRIQAELESVIRGTTHKKSTRYCFWWDNQPSKVGPVDSPEIRQVFRQGMAALTPPQPGQQSYGLAGRGKESFGIIWARKATRRGIFNVVIAYSGRYAYNEMREFRNVILVLGGCVVLITAAATYLVILAGLRPIDRTARVIATISERNMDRTDLDTLPVPPELKPFVGALSDMLGWLDVAMRAQRRFTADASHELRTPLALAKSMLQAVRNRPRETAEYERAIDETLTDLERMERLVGQLLMLARLDHSGLVQTRREVRLDALVAHVAAEEAAALGAGSRLACEALAPVVVQGEENLLAVMTGNLVRNALIHGPLDGKVTVTVEALPDQARLLVRDEGGNIPPEDVAKLFERFCRLDASRSRQSGGTGLGLALSQEIARRHGGDISICSQPEQGTRVTVCLPRCLST